MSGRRRRAEKADRPEQPSGQQPSEPQLSGQQVDDQRARVQEPGDQQQIAGGDRPHKRSVLIPVVALGLALVCVVAVVVWSVLTPSKQLSVDDLESPAVGALAAGSAVYPPESREALLENMKFAYLPTVDVALTSDSVPVLANAQTAQQTLKLQQPLDQTDAKTFLAARIPAPRSGESDGSPITWDDAMKEFGGKTVFIATVSADTVLNPVLQSVRDNKLEKSVIVRSANAQVLSEAKSAGVATMSPVGTSTPEAFAASGATFAEVPHDTANLDGWLKSGPKVWLTGVTSKDDLAGFAKRGAFGALTNNPFALQPPSDKAN